MRTFKNCIVTKIKISFALSFFSLGFFTLCFSALTPASTALAKASKSGSQLAPSKPTQNTGAENEVLKLKTDLAKLQQTIDSLNANLSCRQDSDCVAVAIGSKACGGPAKYLVSSNQNKYLPEIQEKAKQSIELEDRLNHAARIISTCSYVAEPEVKCSKQVCHVFPTPMPAEGTKLNYSTPQ